MDREFHDLANRSDGATVGLTLAPETDARTLTFVSLVLVNLGLVLVNRSFATSLAKQVGKANRALAWVATATFALLALVVIWSVGREMFRFGPLHTDDLMLIAITVEAGLGPRGEAGGDRGARFQGEALYHWRRATA